MLGGSLLVCALPALTVVSEAGALSDAAGTHSPALVQGVGSGAGGTVLQKPARPSPPERLSASAGGGGWLVGADGSLERYHLQPSGIGARVMREVSQDFGRTWSASRTVGTVAAAVGARLHALRDRDGELHGFFARPRGEGTRPAVDRFIDLWHLRSTGGGRAWTEPQRIFEGYVGAFQQVLQLRSGRLLLPFARWIGGRPSAPPTGSNVTTAVFSDDGGKNWRLSAAELTAPCYEGFNGNNYGAIEPTVLEREDGSLWMLLRTQTGFLYESTSRNGADWTVARPTRFHSSTSPAFPLRLRDGRLLLFWNNCAMPPRTSGQGVYGGRDVLHAAISTDAGRTWRGFREVYRDPFRNQDPPAFGDRGTAYPWAMDLPDGMVLLVSGQGEGRRAAIRVDPNWLLEREQEERFSGDLEQWSVFRPYGPAVRFWRARTQGPQIVDVPDAGAPRALRLRREPNRDADGAVWNFPALRRGRLTTEYRLEPGSAGGTVSLVDHFLDPTDPAGEARSLFTFALPHDSSLAASRDWNQVTLEWDLGTNRCRVRVNGRALPDPLRRTASTLESFGASYFRLRSAAPVAQSAGILLRAVRVR